MASTSRDKAPNESGCQTPLERQVVPVEDAQRPEVRSNIETPPITRRCQSQFVGERSRRRPNINILSSTHSQTLPRLQIPETPMSAPSETTTFGQSSSLILPGLNTATSPPSLFSFQRRQTGSDRRCSYSQGTSEFEDVADLSLFAQALSGLDDTYDPMNPRGHVGASSTLPREHDFSQPSMNIPANAHPFPPQVREYYQPQQVQVRASPNTNAANMFAEATSGLSIEEGQEEAEEEPPNYAQSQHQASLMARRAAARRAAELERRWAESSQGGR